MRRSALALVLMGLAAAFVGVLGLAVSPRVAFNPHTANDQHPAIYVSGGTCMTCHEQQPRWNDSVQPRTISIPVANPRAVISSVSSYTSARPLDSDVHSYTPGSADAFAAGMRQPYILQTESGTTVIVPPYADQSDVGQPRVQMTPERPNCGDCHLTGYRRSWTPDTPTRRVGRDPRYDFG
jgi:hypothetical protein